MAHTLQFPCFKLIAIELDPLLAIKYFHSKNIVHRDLKPENILLDFVNEKDKFPLVKITDLGLSKLVDESVLKTFCGTPQYLAPEILTSRVRGDGTYSHKVDCWSMGVILFILLSGSPPFAPKRPDRKELVPQIVEGDYSFDPRLWSNVSHEAIDLIKNLMDVNVERRLSASEALLHPWIANDEEIIRRANQIMGIFNARKRTSNGNEPTMSPDRKRLKIGLND